MFCVFGLFLLVFYFSTHARRPAFLFCDAQTQELKNNPALFLGGTAMFAHANHGCHNFPRPICFEPKQAAEFGARWKASYLPSAKKPRGVKNPNPTNPTNPTRLRTEGQRLDKLWPRFFGPKHVANTEIGEAARGLCGLRFEACCVLGAPYWIQHFLISGDLFLN